MIVLALRLIVCYVLIVPILNEIDEIVKLRYLDTSYFTLLETLLPMVFIIPFFEELIFRHFLRYSGLKTKLISLKRWTKIFPILVYSSSICFGFIHLTNYSNSSTLFFIFAPIIVLSQLIGGITLAFVRVRLDFLWGVLFHCAWNFLVFAIPVVENSFIEPYTEKTSQYTITIEDQLFFDPQKQYVKIDSAGGKIQSVSVAHYTIQNVLDTLYQKDKYRVDDLLINLNFESKDGVTKEAFLKILQKDFEIE